MRAKVSKEKKAIAAPISLYPEQKAWVRKRAFQLGMSVSKYFQKLLESDRKKEISVFK